jgi:hypothetical protein
MKQFKITRKVLNKRNIIFHVIYDVYFNSEEYNLSIADVGESSW